MQTEIVRIEATQLDEVVKNSGLSIKEGDEIKQSYLPFLSRLVEIQNQSNKINYNEPAEIDEKIARELRLSTVKIRTDAEKLKDEQKKVDLLRGKIKQDSYNLIASSCKLAEEVFYNVEKARDLAEKKRKEQLKIDRTQKLLTVIEDISAYNLGELTDPQFDQLYLGLKTAREMKLKAEQEAEEKRKRDEEIRLLHIERKESIIYLWNFASDLEKSLNFGEQSESDFNNFVSRLNKAKAAHDAEQEKIRIENERLQKENELKEKELQKQKDESERKLREQKRKQEEERKRLEAIALEEQKKQIELQRQLKQKEDEDKERKRLAEIEEKKQREAKKKAEQAPDKEKLLAVINSLLIQDFKVNSIDSQAVKNDIINRFNGFKNWAINEINTKL